MTNRTFWGAALAIAVYVAFGGIGANSETTDVVFAQEATQIVYGNVDGVSYYPESVLENADDYLKSQCWVKQDMKSALSGS